MNNSIPSFNGNLWRVLLPGNHLNQEKQVTGMVFHLLEIKFTVGGILFLDCFFFFNPSVVKPNSVMHYLAHNNAHMFVEID